MALRDPLEEFGLKSGQRKQKPGETNRAFLKRMCGRYGRETFLAVLGDIPCFAQVYDVPESLVRDLLAGAKHVKEKTDGHICPGELVKHHRAGLLLEQADKKRANMEKVSAAAELREQAKRGEKADAERKRWPSDPKKRREAVKEYLLKAFIDEESRVSRISEISNLSKNEILEMRDSGDDELMAAYQRGLKLALVEIQEQMIDSAAKSGSPAAHKAVLKSVESGLWGDHSSVDVNHTGGFSMPEEDELPVAIGPVGLVSND